MFGVAVVIEAEQRVGQHRPRRGAPARAGAKIVHQDVAKGERFEIAVAPAHRRFDDAVADREQAVARHGGVEAAATGEERRRKRRVEILEVRPPHRHAGPGEKFGETIDLAARLVDQVVRKAPALLADEGGARFFRHHRLDPDMPGRKPAGFDGADDDLLQSVPFVVDGDRARDPAVDRGGRRRGKWLGVLQDRNVHTASPSEAEASSRRKPRGATVAAPTVASSMKLGR